jgi:hypothetical protein
VDWLRVSLAFLSFTAALSLLFVGYLRAKKIHRAKKVVIWWTYALMFMVAAIILWQGKKSQAVAAPPVLEPSDIKTFVPTTGTRKDSGAYVTPQPATLIAKTDYSGNSTMQSLPVRNGGQVIVRSVLKKKVPIKKFSTKSSVVNAREDRAYVMISKVFDSIERFFYSFGSPVPESGKFREEISQESLTFPPLGFRPGTAELTLDSREDLADFMQSLRRFPLPDSIEIQVQTNEAGLEPLNNLLAQARAETVRDLFLDRGFNSSHFRLKATSSEGTDSLGMGSHVRLVTRP